MRKIVISLLFGLMFSMLIMAYADETQKGIADSLVRLHIVANSDSKIDQSVKLAVRDAVISELSAVISDAKNPSHAQQIINDNLPFVEKTAQIVLEKNNLSYGATALCTISHFPTKQYENITLPAGNYNALKIILGNGDGQNWWCVMYPPLCFQGSVDGNMNNSAKELLKSNLDDDEYALICENSTLPVKFKFKIFEIFDKLNNR